MTLTGDVIIKFIIQVKEGTKCFLLQQTSVPAYTDLIYNINPDYEKIDIL